MHLPGQAFREIVNPDSIAKKPIEIGVMTRWRDFITYHNLDRPQLPLPAAFQKEFDRENWLVKVSEYERPRLAVANSVH